MEDAAVTLEDPNSLNNCSEQVFLLFLSNSALSKDVLTQSILAVSDYIKTNRVFFFFNYYVRFISETHNIIY